MLPLSLALAAFFFAFVAVVLSASRVLGEALLTDESRVDGTQPIAQRVHFDVDPASFRRSR